MATPSCRAEKKNPLFLEQVRISSLRQAPDRNLRKVSGSLQDYSSFRKVRAREGEVRSSSKANDARPNGLASSASMAGCSAAVRVAGKAFSLDDELRAGTSTKKMKQTLGWLLEAWRKQPSGLLHGSNRSLDGNDWWCLTDENRELGGLGLGNGCTM